MKTVKCIFCGVWVQNFVWNFKGHLWNFTQNFEPIHRKICILRGAKKLTTYDILKWWHLKCKCAVTPRRVERTGEYRDNGVWENPQHVQNWTCVNHPPTCSKRVSNVSKPTAHRVDTVLVTFPKRFHTVCERVAACQTSIQRVPDVYVTCKYRAQRVSSDRPAVIYRATSVRLPYFRPCYVTVTV